MSKIWNWHLVEETSFFIKLTAHVRKNWSGSFQNDSKFLGGNFALSVNLLRRLKGRGRGLQAPFAPIPSVYALFFHESQYSFKYLLMILHPFQKFVLLISIFCSICLIYYYIYPPFQCIMYYAPIFRDKQCMIFKEKTEMGHCIET